jgi:hypothetical protein
MSVLSWGERSLATGSWPILPGFLSSFGGILHLIVAVSILVLLSACNASPRKPDLIFDAGSLTHKQWEQADKECKFEAAKAVAPLKYGDVTGDTYRKIYILCIEAKGVRFLGSEDQINRRAQ